MRYIPVRLIRKLADEINGLDLSRYQVGDVIEVPGHTALMLMGEGWALPLDSPVLRSRDLSRPIPASDIDRG
jgi:hypothetical protein